MAHTSAEGPRRAAPDNSGHDHEGHAHRGHPHQGGHDHGGHHHGHDHAGHLHAPASFGAAFAVGALLNVGYVGVEVACGIAAHSVALLADAGHNLGDVLALLVAWGASVAAARRPSTRYTYGLRSTSMLAALLNAVTLLVVTGGVTWEAIRRLAHPEPVGAAVVMAAAAGGILVNGVTAVLFARGRESDINRRAAFLHMLSDAGVSAGVVAAGGLMLLTGLRWIDPVTSLIVSALVVWGTWALLRESVDMVLHAVPSGIEPDAVRGYLERLPGVEAIHDLHIWPMSTTETALTCHLVIPRGHPGDPFLGGVCGELRHRFGIGHATLQVEIDAAFACPLEPAHVV